MAHLPRDYHGTAILLPDGRILQAGGNTYAGTTTQDSLYALKAEVYCPPYLFDTNGNLVPRPAFHATSVPPGRISYRQAFHLGMTSGPHPAALDSVVLIKPGAATHGFDQDQRFIRLPFYYCGLDSTVLEVIAPPDSNIAPPGDYLMFLVYKKDVAHGFFGTPSIAKWVRVGTVTGADVCSCPGGGCPIAESRAAAGWTIKNTILARSADGIETDDALLLTHTPVSENGRITVRLRENEKELTTLDRAQLAVVDHPPGTEVFASGSRTLVGRREGAYHVTTSRGDDITLLVTGGPGSTGWTGQAGDIVTVEMDSPVRIHRPGVDRGVGAVAADLKEGPGGGGGGASLRPTGATTNRDAPWLDQTGILIQLPDGAGGWRTAAHQYPREKPDAALVDSLAQGTYRIVFVGRHHLSFLGRIVPASSGVTTQTLSPVSAVHTRLGEVVAATNGNGASTNLAPGDTLTLSFAAPDPKGGMVRDVVLLTHGVYTSNLSDRRGLPVGAALPAQFALEQNVPNPFSGTTSIRFALPTANRVKIELFDLFGRRIRTLTDAQWTAGYHQVEWDRRDGSGNVVRSGVFMYRMTAGSFTDHKKLVIAGN